MILSNGKVEGTLLESSCNYRQRRKTSVNRLAENKYCILSTYYRRSRVRFPAGAGNFSLDHRIQNGSGAHPTSYSMGIRGYFPGGKTAGA
jgi:hypothetical protein